MSLRPIVAVLVLPLAAIACGPQGGAPGDGGTWVGTITTEGSVTTVINESGSVWGGTATLVEEASIGVESGPAEYMFGRINALAADDQRIYVVEARPPVVRVYDLDGIHVMNIGTQGQGPGELALPSSIVLMPDGRLMVRDDDNARISFFSAEGALIEDWSLPGGFFTSSPSFVTPDGTLYSPQLLSRDPASIPGNWGVVPYGSGRRTRRAHSQPRPAGRRCPAVSENDQDADRWTPGDLRWSLRPVLATSHCSVPTGWSNHRRRQR